MWLPYDKSAGLKPRDRVVRISVIQALVGSLLAITASSRHYITAISSVKFLSRFSVSLACVVSEQISGLSFNVLVLFKFV